MTRRSYWLALLALGACDKPAEQREMTAEEVAEQLAAVRIEPGEWQATTEILSVKGPLPSEAVEQMVGNRSSVTNCITPEQARRPSANFLAAQKDGNCSYRDFSMKDGRISGTMSCTGGQLPGEMVTRMSGDYGPQSYDMIMDMTTGIPGGLTMEIKARTRGQRVGQCG